MDLLYKEICIDIIRTNVLQENDATDSYNSKQVYEIIAIKYRYKCFIFIIM